MANDVTPAPTIPEKPTPMASPASPWQITALGLALVFLCLLLVYVFLTLWPGDLAKKHGDDVVMVTWFGTSLGFNATIDTRLLLLVMVTGALGSFVHAATSFADFVGNQKLATNWVWWYILRPFIGMSLAAIFYVAIRAGFLTAGGQPDTINLYGIAALAGMVGMFSKQATDKLSEVFDTLFRTTPGGGDGQRKDGLDSPSPVLRLLDPATLAKGATPAVVSVRGSGFTASSLVRVRDSDRPTQFKDSGELIVTLLPADVEGEGQLDIVVVTPPPGGGRSSTLSLRVGGAAPATEGVRSPAAAPAGLDDNEVDGCAIPVVIATADAALPAARGGVA